MKTRKERGRDLLEQCQTASHTLVVSVVTSDVLSFGPCSFVVLKGKISVLGLGLGLQGQVLGPAKDEKLVKDYTDTVSCH